MRCGRSSTAHCTVTHPAGRARPVGTRRPAGSTLSAPPRRASPCLPRLGSRSRRVWPALHHLQHRRHSPAPTRFSKPGPRPRFPLSECRVWPGSEAGSGTSASRCHGPEGSLMNTGPGKREAQTAPPFPGHCPLSGNVDGDISALGTVFIGKDQTALPYVSSPLWIKP